MWFCTFCGTLLTLPPHSPSTFVCPTCPYTLPLTTALKTNIPTRNPKKVDDVLGGAGAWDNVDKTAATCPMGGACGGLEAYFMQIQIRSADEPMSVFYKCTKCSHQWCQR